MRGSRRLALLGPALLLTVLAAPLVAAQAASTTDAAIQSLFNVVLLFGLGIGLFVAILMVYAIAKFRIRKGHTRPSANPLQEHHKLEAVWTIVPAIILLVVGLLAFQTLMFTDTLPQHADVTVTAIGHQWYWEFWSNYTNGTSVHSVGGLSIAANLVVHFIVVSVDVDHSFFIPDLGVHVDAIPGHINDAWVKPTLPGAYTIECTQFCGVSHYAMVGTLTVTPG